MILNEEKLFDYSFKFLEKNRVKDFWKIITEYILNYKNLEYVNNIIFSILLLLKEELITDINKQRSTILLHIVWGVFDVTTNIR